MLIRWTRMLPHSIALATCGGLLLMMPSPSRAQDFSEIHIEHVAIGEHRYLTGLLWSRDGYLLFADAPANRILRWTPGPKQPEVFLDDAEGASGMAFDPQGRLYVCQPRARRVVRIDKKERAEPVATKFEGHLLNAPNDIVVRKDGHAFFTDPAFGYQRDSRELDFFGVYRLASKGEVNLVVKSASRPNGIALAPNGRTLYVSDSDRRAVRAWDLDRSGAASNERVFASAIEGVPNGLCVDEKGNVYAAARNLEIYSPEARHLRTIVFQAPVSSCTFGDPDLESLYVAAGGSLYRVRLDVKGALQY